MRIPKLESVKQVANNLPKALFQISVKSWLGYMKVVSGRHIQCSETT